MLGSLPYREAVRAPATRRTYRSLWQHWEQFALVEGWEPLPADAGCLAEYIEQRGKAGDCIATLKLRRYAIAQYHKQNEHEDPTATDDFRCFMAGVARQHGRPPSQAKGLTSDDLSQIRMIVRTDTDRRDLAICYVMRDAMLRRAETAALTWLDIESQPDGSGALTIRRSKIDQESRGTMQYLSHAAMVALEAIRPVRGRRRVCIRAVLPFDLQADYRYLSAGGIEGGLHRTQPTGGHGPGSRARGLRLA